MPANRHASHVTRRRNLENTFHQRFWSRVDKNGPIPNYCPELGPCWIWTGSVHSNGYGALNRNGKDIGPHRASWEIHFGSIPEDKIIHHRCYVPLCCNPVHLALETYSGNALDSSEKGRWRDQNGIKNNSAKLTDEDVHQIRRIFSKSNCRGIGVQLARQFGVTTSVISEIKNGLAWMHVKKPDHTNAQSA